MDRLIKFLIGVTLIAILALTALSLLLPVIPSLPSLPDFNKTEQTVTASTEVRIISIEPVSLDCRARITAKIPLSATREHKLGDIVYRTDRVTMTAIGDVDTCVDAQGTEVKHLLNGAIDVIIPSESIRFVRPRVDTIKTAESVQVEKDLVGKITDVFPWVSDNDGLAPAAYAYAQYVIGSSECMQAAYENTQQILLDSYREQMVEQGEDPNKVGVRIDGQPDFNQSKPVVLEGFEFQHGQGDDLTCIVSGR